MKSIICLLFAATIIHAEPLWREDGKTIDAWNSQVVKMAVLPDGGFSIGGTGMKPSPCCSRKVPISPDYPWLVFKITNIINNPGQYRAWLMTFPGRKIGQATEAFTGYYAINCYENNNSKDLTKDTATLRFYAYSMGLHISELKMVKKPDYYVDTVITPNKIKFTAYCKEPVEDVTVSLYLSRNQVMLNGKAKLQLKPINEESKIWAAEFPIEKLISANKKSSFKTNELSTKMVILGGEITEPVWSTVNYPYSPE